MSTVRRPGTGEYVCPLDGMSPSMDKCQPCVYFRGASLAGQGVKEWSIVCNWPRNGSHIAPNEPIPIPNAFIEAFK